MSHEPLRLCEYQSVAVTHWTCETRQAVAAAAEAWREDHRLSTAPLSFDGPDGCVLRAEQYVGVVEAGGVRVEIYPKLDKHLVRDGTLDSQRVRSVMGNLLWLLEASGYGGLVDAGEARVEECPESISDLLAWLYARRLLNQLSRGLPQEYMGHEDDLPLVRGSIQFARQMTIHFGRPDLIACAWDERSPDTSLARVLRCAAEVLLHRVRLPGAAADLREALAMMEETTSVPPLLALSEAPQVRWSRNTERFRPCHDLALAVLRGLGRDMHTGSSESFVFLLDMNALFECYCQRWIEVRFDGVRVRDQVPLGSLLVAPGRRLYQYADFLWQERNGILWVGDAKYKIQGGEEWPKIADTRQLICYGQLAAGLHAAEASALMLLYPTTGEEVSETMTTYDGQSLRLQAVRIVA